MRPLIVFFSLSGNTRKVCDLLAKEIGADTVEIACPAYRRPWGPLRMAWDVFTGGVPPVEVPGTASRHDLTILAGPVWGGRPAPPLRGYVRRYAPEAPVVLLLTCGGTSPRYPGEKALEELAGLLKTPPVATGLFKEEQIKAPSLPEAVAEFAVTLRATAGR